MLELFDFKNVIQSPYAHTKWCYEAYNAHTGYSSVSEFNTPIWNTCQLLIISPYMLNFCWCLFWNGNTKAKSGKSLLTMIYLCPHVGSQLGFDHRYRRSIDTWYRYPNGWCQHVVPPITANALRARRVNVRSPSFTCFITMSRICPLFAILKTRVALMPVIFLSLK